MKLAFFASVQINAILGQFLNYSRACFSCTRTTSALRKRAGTRGTQDWPSRWPPRDPRFYATYTWTDALRGPSPAGNRRIIDTVKRPPSLSSLPTPTHRFIKGFYQSTQQSERLYARPRPSGFQVPSQCRVAGCRLTDNRCTV